MQTNFTVSDVQMLWFLKCQHILMQDISEFRAPVKFFLMFLRVPSELQNCSVFTCNLLRIGSFWHRKRIKMRCLKMSPSFETGQSLLKNVLRFFKEDSSKSQTLQSCLTTHIKFKVITNVTFCENRNFAPFYGLPCGSFPISFFFVTFIHISFKQPISHKNLILFLFRFNFFRWASDLISKTYLTTYLFWFIFIFITKPLKLTTTKKRNVSFR